MRISHAGLVIAVGLALTGCQRLNYGSRSDLPSQPAPLTAAPVGGVQQSQLPPPSGAAGSDSSAFPAAPGAGAGANGQKDVASLGSDNAPQIKPESMIGRWTVTTSGSACDLFLSMTKWTGGYRAATRNCSGIAADVSAWDVKGGQVVLSDNVGNQLASVRQAGNQTYRGSTTSGQPITLGR